MVKRDIAAQLAETDAQIEGRLALAAILDLSWFVRLMWAVIEPGTPLVWSPHIESVCDAMQAQMQGDDRYQNTIICMPPGFMKSILVAVMRPAWMWLHWPHRRSIYLSNTDELAERDSRRTRDVLKSPEYRRLVMALAQPARGKEKCPCCGQGVHPAWEFAQDKDEVNNFANTRKGFRQCLSMNSRGKTGARGDDIVWDDPLDADQLSKASPESRRGILDDAHRTVAYVESTRINNPKTATRTGVMQRLAVDDPVGRRIAAGGWRVLNFPQHYDPARACPEDRRTVAGELLCPSRWDELSLALPRMSLGPAQFAAQHEQAPLDEEGGLFRPAMFQRRYTEAPEDVAARCDEVAISVDCTFKGSDSSDRVAMQVWGRQGGARFYLLDRVCARMGFLATVAALRSLCARWPMARVKLVESAANGPAVIEVLSRDIPGVVPFNPRGSSKFERAKVGAMPAFEAGNVYLPDSGRCPWVEEYVAEMVGFSEDCAHDDEVDATSQLMLRWMGSGGESAEVPLLSSRAVLETGVVTRWAERDAGQAYVIGVGVDWSVSASSASYAVVLDETGGQVAAVRCVAGGEEALAALVADEAFYWGGAVVVVGGERVEVAHRVGVLVARSGPKVVCRPGMSIYEGPGAVWGRRDWTVLWSRVGAASRAGLIGMRDGGAHAEVTGVRVAPGGEPRGEGRRGLPVEAVALCCACVSRVAEERPVVVERQRRWKVVGPKAVGGDAWSRTAVGLHNARRM